MKLKVVKTQDFTTKYGDFVRYTCLHAGDFVVVNTMHFQDNPEVVKYDEATKALTIEGKVRGSIEKFVVEETGQELATKYVKPARAVEFVED